MGFKQTFADLLILCGLISGLFMAGVIVGWFLVEVFGTIGPAIWRAL